tara:strand:+ start:6636 stop:7775 length:1140 start_codon:yes stop_codon:yes gene_type:complete
MEKPKVAIVCNSYPTKKNETNQIFIKNLVIELKNQSITTDVYHNPIYNYWGNASNRKGIIANLIKYSFFIIGVSRLIIRIKSYNLLNPHGVMISGFIAVLLKRFFNIPVALHIHGGDLNIYNSSSILYRKVYNNTISNSDLIVVNSNDIKNKVLKLTGVTPNKLIVISPGIDYEKFYRMDRQQIENHKKDFNIGNDKTVLLFAGNAIKRKGLDILVDALKLLRTVQLSKIHLIICSEGPELNKTKNKLQNIEGIKDSVIFLKKMDQSELRILYNIASIFIFPSRDEPLGLVGLEAIACGTPVIGSNIGGIPEYINKNNGMLFEVNKSKELAKRIGSIIEDPNIVQSLTKNIDKRESDHDISVSVKRLIDIYYDMQTRSF